VKKLLPYWPVLVFALAITVFGTEFLVLSSAKIRHFTGISWLGFLIFIEIMAFAGITYEYWFIGWCGSLAVKNGPSLLDLLNTLLNWLKSEGLNLDYLAQPALRVFKKAYKKIRVHIRFRRLRYRKWIKWGGYPIVFIIGVLPIPGARTPLIIICRSFGLRSGLWIICLANAIRVYYLFSGFNWVIS